MSRSTAEVDLAAIAHNLRLLATTAAPARLCAVVKADGYGHGAVPVARAALHAGAAMLAVAQVAEGVALREAGIDAPILLLSEPLAREIDGVVAHRMTPTLYSARTLALVAAAAAGGEPLPVHVKVNTGMNRVGAASDAAVELVVSADADPALRLEGLCTHCAVADDPDDPFTDLQLDRFDAVIAQLVARGMRPPVIHAANSAVAIAHPRGRYDMVRCGIALYGIEPSAQLAGALDLQPALRWTTEVSWVKRVGPGEGVSYGLRHTIDRPTTVATVPVGYADGVRRSLGLAGAPVLIGGRRRPIVGVVTMDQLMVDCGDDRVEIGDEVVLIGQQGDTEVTAGELADAAGTIAYEIACGISARVPRRYK